MRSSRKDPTLVRVSQKKRSCKCSLGSRVESAIRMDTCICNRPQSEKCARDVGSDCNMDALSGIYNRDTAIKLEV
mgnify:CR=1 FL=1